MGRTAHLSYLYRQRNDLPASTADGTSSLAAPGMALPVRDGSGPSMPFSSMSAAGVPRGDHGPSFHDVLWLREALLERMSWLGTQVGASSVPLVLPSSGDPSLYAENLRRIAYRLSEMLSRYVLDRHVQDDPGMTAPPVWPPRALLSAGVCLASSADMSDSLLSGWTPVFSIECRGEWGGTSGVPSELSDLFYSYESDYVREDPLEWTGISRAASDWNYDPGEQLYSPPGATAEGDAKEPLFSYAASGRPVLTPEAVFGLEASEDFASLGSVPEARGLERVEALPLRAMFSDLERLDMSVTLSAGIFLSMPVSYGLDRAWRGYHRSEFLDHVTWECRDGAPVPGMADMSGASPTVSMASGADHPSGLTRYEGSFQIGDAAFLDTIGFPGGFGLVLPQSSPAICPVGYRLDARRSGMFRTRSTYLWCSGSRLDSDGDLVPPGFSAPPQDTREVGSTVRSEASFRAGSAMSVEVSVAAGATSAYAVVGSFALRSESSGRRDDYDSRWDGTGGGTRCSAERSLVAVAYCKAVPLDGAGRATVPLGDLPTGVSDAPYRVAWETGSSSPGDSGGSPSDSGCDGPGSSVPIYEMDAEQTLRAWGPLGVIAVVARRAPPRTSVAANPGGSS